MARIVCLFQARDRPLRAQDIHYFCYSRPILPRAVRFVTKVKVPEESHLHTTHGMTQHCHKPGGLDSCCSVFIMQSVYDGLHVPR